MFTEMINTLRDGQRPSADDLKCRLDLAIVKKGGVLQQPKPCWSGDSKINPVAIHMLWAAVILEDVEAMATVVGMIEIELSSGTPGKDLKEFLLEKLTELSSLSYKQENSKWLNEKGNSATEKLGLKS